MYTKEQLSKFDYFARLLEDTQIDFILDPLTGVVSRKCITGFAKHLIEQGVPFTFGMLDLDNFKFINDTYGHHVGDGVLVNIAKDLSEYMWDYGVIGRFGGDEFLFIDMVDLEYPAKKELFTDLYCGDTVIRRNVMLDTCKPFVTGTIGCATYPSDAKDYDTLFSLIDKTLYRGKTKGRNCYIIYVEEKHKDIEIRKIARHGVCTCMMALTRQFDFAPGAENKLRSVMPLLMDELRITELYYIGSSSIMHSVRGGETFGEMPDISAVLSDEVYSTNNIADIKKKCPALHSFLDERGIETVLLVRIGMENDTDGYLICAEPNSQRIWQEDECALMYFLAKQIAARLRIDGEKLP